jgi:hypothetical protein
MMKGYNASGGAIFGAGMQVLRVEEGPEEADSDKEDEEEEPAGVLPPL